MIQFSQLFPKEAIVATLSQHLSWSHFHTLLPNKDPFPKSIRVSEYLTELPPLPLLRARLHQAIEHARESAARRLPAGDEEVTPRATPSKKGAKK